MALEDPFFVVKDEVLKALLKTRALYDQWRLSEEGTEYRSPEEKEWSATELRNALRSIEWDLEDLDDTVQIVEKNPAKFKIDATELMVRKNFICQTKEEVSRMKADTTKDASDVQPLGDVNDSLMDQVSLSSPTLRHDSGSTPAPSGGQGKYSRLPNDSDSPSKRAVDNVMMQQQKLVQQQDDQLNFMSDSVSNIRSMSHHIGVELDEQAVMLDEFGTEIENAETKLDATMRKMAKVLNMSNDRRQWMAIGVLSSAMLVLFVMIFAL